MLLPPCRWRAFAEAEDVNPEFIVLLQGGFVSHSALVLRQSIIAAPRKDEQFSDCKISGRSATRRNALLCRLCVSYECDHAASASWNTSNCRCLYRTNRTSETPLVAERNEQTVAIAILAASVMGKRYAPVDTAGKAIVLHS